MITISIGRAADNRYTVHDPTNQVSSHHAELTILTNGQMSIRDTSTNGTFVNGRRLQKYQSINVSRQDQVTFANVAFLDWSRIPVIQPIREPKHIVTIGKDGANNYILSSGNSSRFHATLTIDAKGKIYLMDHSSNGTSVNGQRLSPYQYVQVKRGSKVQFANYEKLDWSRVPGGLPFNKWVVITPLILMGLFAISWVLWGVFKPVKSIDDYKNTVVLVSNKFYFTKNIKGKDGKTTTLAYYGVNKNPVYDVADLDEIEPFEIYGTGFFVSDKGHIITNRHVAEPWKEEEFKKAFLQKYQSYYDFLFDVGVSGYSVEIGVITNEKEVRKDDLSKSLILCDSKSVKSHQDPRIDLALMQVNNHSVPVGCGFVKNEDLINSSDEVKVADEVVIMGYPLGLGLWDDDQPFIQNSNDFGKVSMKKNRYELQYNANTAGGASGSPVINPKTGKVVAVNFYSVTGDHNLGIFANHIKDLLNE